jgi:hypothetical protein
MARSSPGELASRWLALSSPSHLRADVTLAPWGGLSMFRRRVAVQTKYGPRNWQRKRTRLREVADVLFQAKQKWGGLRYYYEASDGTLPPAMEAAVAEAEARAAATCEECRATRDVSLYSDRPFVQTLCRSCGGPAHSRRRRT